MPHKITFEDTEHGSDMFAIVFQSFVMGEGGVRGIEALTMAVSFNNKLKEISVEAGVTERVKKKGEHILTLDGKEYAHLKKCLREVQWKPTVAEEVLQAIDLVDNATEVKDLDDVGVDKEARVK